MTEETIVAKVLGKKTNNYGFTRYVIQKEDGKYMIGEAYPNFDIPWEGKGVYVIKFRVVCQGDTYNDGYGEVPYKTWGYFVIDMIRLDNIEDDDEPFDDDEDNDEY